MCYTTAIQKQAEQEQKLAGKYNILFWPPVGLYVGFTYPLLPAIMNTEPNAIQAMKWGLLPHWATQDYAKSTLNAKIETLAELKSYKPNIGNRCIILSDAFVEWQWEDPANPKCKKTKYQLSRADDDAIAFAGIYSPWVNKETGEHFNTFSIVTTEAVGLALEIHNSKKRMPVILNDDEQPEWLGGADHNLFADRSAIDLTAHTI